MGSAEKPGRASGGCAAWGKKEISAGHSWLFPLINGRELGKDHFLPDPLQHSRFAMPYGALVLLE